MKAGVKELKNRLSYYLRRVKEGEHVEIADRGEVFADIKPRKRSKRKNTEKAALEKLAEDGAIIISRHRRPLPEFKAVKLLKPLSASKMILDDRR